MHPKLRYLNSINGVCEAGEVGQLLRTVFCMHLTQFDPWLPLEFPDHYQENYPG